MEESGKKVKPLIELINVRLNLLTISKEVCIDEMMIQSKSRFGPRIYQKGKPNPWGYKLYALSDTHGIVYTMHLYCGAFPQVHGYPDLGSTGNRVLSLVQNVPKNENFQLYMDNFFTRIPLITELGKQEIQLMGTICVNHAPGFTKICMPDKELSNLGNRSFVEYLCKFDGFVDPGIRIIRWDDNSIFNLAHTFGSGYPTVKTQRWHCDHTKKDHQSEMDMSSAIGQYNKCMGGIDEMDHLIALH